MRKKFHWTTLVLVLTAIIVTIVHLLNLISSFPTTEPQDIDKNEVRKTNKENSHQDDSEYFTRKVFIGINCTLDDTNSISVKTNKILDMNFKIPSDADYYVETYDDMDWGVYITSARGIKYAVCTGCTPTGAECSKEGEFACTKGRTLELNNLKFVESVLEQKLAYIMGAADWEGDPIIRIKTLDQRIPTYEDIQEMSQIISCISWNR